MVDKRLLLRALLILIKFLALLEPLIREQAQREASR